MALSDDREKPGPPSRCAVAYKEWAGVCRALGEGRQTVLLRKGGIAEDAGEFRPEHPAFWLFPTYTHEAQQGLRVPERESAPATGTVDLRWLAVVESVSRLDRLEDCLRLGEFHAWTEETIRKRFAYRAPGLWLMAVRVYVREAPWTMDVTPEMAGCKTWVPLASPPDPAPLRGALDDAVAGARRRALDEALGPLARGGR